MQQEPRYRIDGIMIRGPQRGRQPLRPFRTPVQDDTKSSQQPTALNNQVANQGDRQSSNIWPGPKQTVINEFLYAPQSSKIIISESQAFTENHHGPTNATVGWLPPGNSPPNTPRQNHSKVLHRQAVLLPDIRPARPFEAPTKTKHQLGKGQVTLTTLALLIFVVGLWVSVNTWRINHAIKSQVSALAQHSSTSSDGAIASNQVPDETPPKGNMGDYRVAPDLPRFISVPKLQVKSRVLRLSVDANDQLKTPASIYNAGWYEGSAKPGEVGAVLIDGHINGPSLPGVFFGLKNLAAGDEIDIERGDGKQLQYRVVKSQSFPKDQVDMSSALVPITPGLKGLNLITCYGKPVQGKDFTYDQRLIVYAVQVD